MSAVGISTAPWRARPGQGGGGLGWFPSNTLLRCLVVPVLRACPSHYPKPAVRCILRRTKLRWSRSLTRSWCWRRRPKTSRRSVGKRLRRNWHHVRPSWLSLGVVRVFYCVASEWRAAWLLSSVLLPSHSASSCCANVLPLLHLTVPAL